MLLTAKINIVSSVILGGSRLNCLLHTVRMGQCRWLNSLTFSGLVEITGAIVNVLDEDITE